MSRKSTLVGLALIAACTFGTQRPILSSSTIGNVLAVATNVDSDVMFLSDASGRLVQADPATGAVQEAYDFYLDVAPAAITSDGQDSTDVWVLHGDGWLVNWGPGLTITDWYTPLPMGSVTTRTWCDLDHTLDGDLYLTTVDDGTPRLWQMDGTTEQWDAPVEVDGNGCPRVAHDLLLDELYTLQGNGITFEQRDADTLAVLDSFPLDSDGGAMADVDVYGNEAVVVGVSSGSRWMPAPRRAWSFDPRTGAVDDSETLSSMGTPNAVQIALNEASGDAEMLVGANAGAWTVKGVLLW